jgi:hypothetical protein
VAYIGRPSIVGNFVKLDAISVVNGQAAYTMQNSSANFTDYSSVNQFMVSLNGTIQSPGSSFTVSGSTITFASNLVTNDVIDFIIVFGNSLSSGVPTDATVTTAKLADDAVTSAKLASLTDKVQLTRARNNTLGNPALEILPSDTVVGYGFRMESSNNDLVFEKSAPSGSEAELLRFKAGGGIALGGTGTANTLDDYEEGTWTPTFTHGGSSVSFTLNRANYTKVGRLVYVTLNARYTGSDLTGGNLIGSGLPFTSSSDNVLGVTGGYIHDPGSGNTNYDAGIAGSHNGNTDFYLIVTPGGRYQQRWLQNYYLSVGFWYFV